MIRRHITPRGLVAALALSTLVATSCVPPGPPTTYRPPNADTFAEYVFMQRIKNTRAFLGSPALWTHGTLGNKARWWSQQMANGTCAPGKICHSQLSLGVTGHVRWTRLGENVGVGGNLDSLWNAFMNSPPHRANILDHRWHYFSVGVVRTGNTFWVTMEFMRV